ncbi:MAG TPA: hypothetical protein VMX97_04185, partial [Hyphomicrobiaceae bacterium]|nr:hypothetical protein [Hyphomicrobiaceae bacterium]
LVLPLVTGLSLFENLGDILVHDRLFPLLYGDLPPGTIEPTTHNRDCPPCALVGRDVPIVWQ